MLLIPILLYLVLTLLIGVWAYSKVKNSRDFIVAGRNLPPAFNAAALFALWFGSETVFGASSEFLTHGLIGVIEDPFGGVLCFLILAIFYVRKLYRMNILTISDLFRNHFGKNAEILSAVAMVVSFFGYVGAQMVALGLIFSTLTGIPLYPCLLLGAFFVTLYTFIGGMWAVSVTDFVQSIVIIFGLICLAVYWAIEAGGVQAVLNSPPVGHYTFFPEANSIAWMDWLSAWAVLGLGSIASQDVFQRINSARSERAAVSSAYIGAGIYLVISMLPLFLILAANLLYPDLIQGDSQSVLPQAVLLHAPLWIQVLFFGSILSAVMSTCSGALLAPASILAENLIKPYFPGANKDKTFLWITRFSILFVALVALYMARANSNIFELVAESSIFGLVSLFVPMTFALYNKHNRPSGAMLAMIMGIGCWSIFNYVWILPINALIPGLIGSTTGMLIGNTEIVGKRFSRWQ